MNSQNGYQPSLSDASRPLWEHIRKTGATDTDASRIAVVFTNAYGDKGQAKFDLFRAHGWNAADIRDLMVLGHACWRDRPEWLLMAECVLVQRLDIEPRNARKCVIKNKAYAELDPERLANGIDAFKTLHPYDTRDLEWIAEYRPRVFYCDVQKIEAWHEKHRASPHRISNLSQLVHVVKQSAAVKPVAPKMRIKKPLAKPSSPASTTPPTPNPQAPTVIVKTAYDLFPKTLPRAEEPAEEDLSFNTKELERVIRTAFLYDPAQADYANHEKRMRAPFYGSEPKELNARLRELLSVEKSKNAKGLPSNWARFWKTECSWMLDNGRNILDLNDFLESSFGTNALFLLHRILRRSDIIPILRVSWKTTAMRVAVLRRRVEADILAHPELLLWPFETLDDTALRYRVNLLNDLRLKANRRPFIDLLFATTNESFKNGVATAMRLLGSR